LLPGHILYTFDTMSGIKIKKSAIYPDSAPKSIIAFGDGGPNDIVYYVDLLKMIQTAIDDGTLIISPQGGIRYRVSTEVHDELGSGELIWDKLDGRLPQDIENYFEVFAQGKRLAYPAEFTVDYYIGPGQSRINILNPIPDTYYTLIMYT
jgi:hypothetical protein